MHLHRYGFNAGLTAPGNLSKGNDSLSQDFPTIAWRLRELGFNAVRMPFSFKHFLVRLLVPVATKLTTPLYTRRSTPQHSMLEHACMHGDLCCEGRCVIWRASHACVQDEPVDYTQNCTVAGNYETRRSMVPATYPKLPRNGLLLPDSDPPVVPASICNIAMPSQSTRQRYLWVSMFLLATFPADCLLSLDMLNIV